MRRTATISILGYDGTGPCPEIQDIWQIVIPEAQQQFPDLDLKIFEERTPWGQPVHPHREWATDRVMEYMYAWFITQAHNSLVAHANKLANLEDEATRTVATAEQAYADLNKNTTINWLAAHHRYVLACITARNALTRHAELATELAGRDDDILKPVKQSLHAFYYTAHVPEHERIQLPTKNTAASIRQALADFVALCTRRFETLRATITGTFPPGFAPTPADVTAEWAGENIPVSPALVYADQAMRIPGPRAGDENAPARSW